MAYLDNKKYDLLLGTSRTWAIYYNHVTSLFRQTAFVCDHANSMTPHR